jgi:translation initiation factor 3 subunit H
MATVPDTTSPLSEVQIEALVVMRIIKHATSTFPTPATGFLVGTDVASQLQLTNCFPLPAAPMDKEQQDSYHQPDAATLATAAPRAKANVSYQNEMIKLLREVNVDAQSVGWYMSTNMGSFISQSFVENQYFYQKASDEKSVALVFDVSRSSAGSLGLKAYRLSPSFMAAYKEGKFTSERYAFSTRYFECPWRTRRD